MYITPKRRGGYRSSDEKERERGRENERERNMKNEFEREEKRNDK